MADSPRALLFVYGTLRRGGAAHGLLRGGRWMRDATVHGTLYAVDARYPALVLGGAGWVHGEVWAVPEALLPALDRYEGVAEGLFVRSLETVDGEPCWVYQAGPALAPRLRERPRLASGRWGG